MIMNKNYSLRAPRSRLAHCVFLLTVLVLSACQSTHQQQSPALGTIRPNEVQAEPSLDTFKLSGKVSLKESTSPGPRQRTRAAKFYTAEIHWTQAGDRFDIDLSGPLNQGHIKILGNRHLATLWDQHGKAHRADSPEQLLTRITGIGFPLAALTDWITGRPQRPSTLTDVTWETLPDGTVKIHSFSHLGWSVTYREWARWHDIWLPKKLQLEDAARTLKVFVYDWQNLSTDTP